MCTGLFFYWNKGSVRWCYLISLSCIDYTNYYKLQQQSRHGILCHLPLKSHLLFKVNEEDFAIQEARTDSPWKWIVYKNTLFDSFKTCLLSTKSIQNSSNYLLFYFLLRSAHFWTLSMGARNNQSIMNYLIYQHKVPGYSPDWNQKLLHSAL